MIIFSYTNIIITIVFLIFMLYLFKTKIPVNSVIFLFSLGFFVPNTLLSVFIIIDLFYELIIKKKKIILSVFILSIIIGVYISVISIYLNNSFLIDISVFEIITGLLLLNLVSIKFTTRESFHKMLVSINLFSGLLGVYGLIQFLYNFVHFGTILRINSLFTNPVTFSTYAAFHIIVGLYLLKDKFYFKYIRLFRLILFINVTCVLLAMSRASWFGLAGIILTSFIFSNIKHKLKILFGSILGISLLVVIIPDIVLSNFFERFSSAFDYNDPSTNYRISLFLATFEIIKANLWFGTGFNRFMDYVGLYNTNIISSKITHPHNTYLELIQTMGLIGAFLFILLFFIISKKSKYYYLKNENRLMFKSICVRMIIFFSIFGMFDRILTSFDTSIIFWLILGLMINKYLYTPK